MSFGQSISHVLKNITNFEGRASRSEFWWWYVAIVILALIVNLVAWLISGAGSFTSTLFTIIFIVVYAVVALATLAVGARRLHDTGRSGWWWLLWLACCVGQVILLIFWLIPSQPGPNQHGDAAPTA